MVRAGYQRKRQAVTKFKVIKHKDGESVYKYYYSVAVLHPRIYEPATSQKVGWHYLVTACSKVWNSMREVSHVTVIQIVRCIFHCIYLLKK